MIRCEQRPPSTSFCRGYDVSLLDSATYQAPPDLLRRFVPTPLRTRFRIGTATVMVETNDFALLPALPLECGSPELVPSKLEWKLVRDPDAHGLLRETALLSWGQVTVAAMGAACVLGVDHERGELLCFIGADVDTRTFQEFLVPLFCRLSTESNDSARADRFNEGSLDG
jgi:hypothetical protein